MQACAGAVLIDRLASINERRAQNSRLLAEGLLTCEGYEIPGFSPDHCPTYLRLPVLCPDRYSRDGAIGVLNRIGVVASPMYPSTIRRIDGIEPYLAAPDDDFPGAQAVVERLLSLPTHPYVGHKDIRRMIACLTGEQDHTRVETDY